jgi:hypothetical protein
MDSWVVGQLTFCWYTIYEVEWDYEVKAINDMMNRSAGDGNAVRIGYLIKMDFTVNGKNNPPTAGLDIYKVPRGTTVANAIANANGAQHIVYTPGQAQDVPIVITASDLGVTGFWAYFLGSFKISVRNINSTEFYR